jgi:hypothetical protein
MDKYFNQNGSGAFDFNQAAEDGITKVDAIETTYVWENTLREVKGTLYIMSNDWRVFIPQNRGLSDVVFKSLD